MTLTSLLEIDRRLLAYDDERPLNLAEIVWLERGSPRDPQSLTETLEAILQRLQSQGIYYPKILLLRKKQLQRGAWAPRLTTSESVSPVNGPNQPEGPPCQKCGGGGVRNLPSGSGTFCDCAAGDDFRNGKWR
jgi:hypothetical protein